MTKNFGKLCLTDTCTVTVRSKNSVLCARCWAKKHNPECYVTGCSTYSWVKGLCSKHDMRLRTSGSLKDPEPPSLRYKQHTGYIVCYRPNHPSAPPSGIIGEHRLVMEELLGRYLTSEESVHHKNGIRDDNRAENLELWSKSQPTGQRVKDKVTWAIELLERYAPERLRGYSD